MRARASLAALLIAATTGPSLAQTSALWGAHGELWSAQGRLPDFSHAGYRSGEAPLPSVPVTANVLDFGAKADGLTDDSAAIQAAIDATSHGAVLIPVGRYRLSNVIRIEKSGVVLRGEGSTANGSVLVVDRSLSDVFGPEPKWSYTGGFLHVRSTQGGTSLGAVTAPAPRGARTLAIAAASTIPPGQLVELRQVDDGSGSLGRHLHAELADSGTCAYQLPLHFDWPVRVETMAGTELKLRQPLRAEMRLEWSPELWALPAIAEVGIEHLRIELPDVPYAGHLKEPGYNAVFLSDGVVDSWVRDVTVVNADNAFLSESKVKNVSFIGVRTEGRQGHHGFNLNQSADVLIDGFSIQSEWRHTVTVDHRTQGTVVTRGTSPVPMSLDHHRDSPFENLFTELSACGFQSGGSACAGPQAGARNTYWNLAAPMLAPLLWTTTETNIVGNLSSELEPRQTEKREWLEHLPQPDPPNLYDAQLGARLCGPPANPCVRFTWEATSATCGETPRPDGAPCGAGSSCSDGACKKDADEPGGACSCRAAAGGSSPWLIALCAVFLVSRRRKRP